MSNFIRLAVPRQQEMEEHSIVINATSSIYAVDSSNSLYIKPIRAQSGFSKSLYYNPTSGEIVYADVSGGGSAGGGGGDTLWKTNQGGDFLEPSGALVQGIMLKSTPVFGNGMGGFMAAGLLNTANGGQSIAMGNQNNAGGQSSLAVGYISSASGNYAVALGGENSSSGLGSVTAGLLNDASGEAAVALGRQNTASGNRAVALGYNNTSSNTASTAIGSGSLASNEAAVAIGGGCESTGNGSVALGRLCKAEATGAFAAGSGNIAESNYSVAMGQGCTAKAYRDVVMGWDCSSSGGYSICAGRRCSIGSSASGSVAMGMDNIVDSVKTYSVVMGHANHATERSWVIGEYNLGGAFGGVAMGMWNRVTGNNAVAIGYRNTSSGVCSIAMGRDCSGTGEGAVAMGKENKADDIGAIALGFRNQANAAYSLCAGVDCSTNNLASIAMGNKSKAGNDATPSTAFAFAAGEGCWAFEDYSIAMGQDCSANGVGSVALGIGCEVGQGQSGAQGLGGVAIGHQCKAREDYNVALGSSADASGTCGFMYKDSCGNEFCFDSGGGTNQGVLKINGTAVAGAEVQGYKVLKHSTWNTHDGSLNPVALKDITGITLTPGTTFNARVTWYFAGGGGGGGGLVDMSYINTNGKTGLGGGSGAVGQWTCVDVSASFWNDASSVLVIGDGGEGGVAYDGGLGAVGTVWAGYGASGGQSTWPILGTWTDQPEGGGGSPGRYGLPGWTATIGVGTGTERQGLSGEKITNFTTPATLPWNYVGGVSGNTGVVPSGFAPGQPAGTAYTNGIAWQTDVSGRGGNAPLFGNVTSSSTLNGPIGGPYIWPGASGTIGNVPWGSPVGSEAPPGLSVSVSGWGAGGGGGGGSDGSTNGWQGTPGGKGGKGGSAMLILEWWLTLP